MKIIHKIMCVIGLLIVMVSLYGGLYALVEIPRLKDDIVKVEYNLGTNKR